VRNDTKQSASEQRGGNHRRLHRHVSPDVQALIGRIAKVRAKENAARKK
jgi:hypothetical protein